MVTLATIMLLFVSLVLMELPAIPCRKKPGDSELFGDGSVKPALLIGKLIDFQEES
jgi:hypothetical protein